MSVHPLSSKLAGLNLIKNKGVRTPEYLGVHVRELLTESTRVDDVIEKLNPSESGISVRSAGIDEDTAKKSKAGKYLSFNGLTHKTEIQEAVNAIIADFETHGIESTSSIIFQKTVPSILSGVLFASQSHAGWNIYIESNLGSCRGTVDGIASPIKSHFSKGQWEHVLSEEKSINFIAHPLVFDETDFDLLETGGRLYTSTPWYPKNIRLLSATKDNELKVYGNTLKEIPALLTERLPTLMSWCDLFTNEFDGGIDAEWGIDMDGIVYFYQVRNLTSALPTLTSMKKVVNYVNAKSIAGTPASRGKASGYIVHEKSNVPAIDKRQRILMISEANIENVHDLSEYAGVLSLSGGILCHLAIVCREENIPCIVGIQTMIKENTFVEIDAFKGIITITS